MGHPQAKVGKLVRNDGKEMPILLADVLAIVAGLEGRQFHHEERRILSREIQAFFGMAP